MPKSPKNTLSNYEQRYYNRVVMLCVNTLVGFGYKVDNRTIFTNGKSIGAFRSLLKCSVRPRGRLEQKVVDIIMGKTDPCFYKTYYGGKND